MPDAAHPLSDWIGHYDALIVDLWGVIHDGTTLYPGVADTLSLLARMPMPVLFLSNAPRLAFKAEANLMRLGIPRTHYTDIITSGQVAYDMLADHPATRRYYYLGPGKDEDVLSGLSHYVQEMEPQRADFILCTGYEEDGQPHEDILPLLAQLLPVPMLCINPDLEIVKQDGFHMLCAGTVAAAYQQMGGKVAYVGKPFPEVYEACRVRLGSGRFLAIGDNPATDIRGANEAGIDSVLITGGVLSHHYGQDIDEEKAREICAAAGANPTYVLKHFGDL